jgi:hypothetical protein
MENDNETTVIPVPAPDAISSTNSSMNSVVNHPTVPAANRPAREIKIQIPDIKWSQVQQLMPKNVTAQSKLAILGLAVPAYLVWLASYFAFSVAPVTSALNGKDLEGMNIFQRIFVGLGFGGGILYVVLGGAILAAAFWLYRRSFKAYGLRDLQLGQIRLESTVHGVLAFCGLIFASTLLLTVLQINPEALSLISSFASFFN